MPRPAWLQFVANQPVAGAEMHPRVGPLPPFQYLTACRPDADLVSTRQPAENHLAQS